LKMDVPVFCARRNGCVRGIYKIGSNGRVVDSGARGYPSIAVVAGRYRAAVASDIDDVGLAMGRKYTSNE